MIAQWRARVRSACASSEPKSAVLRLTRPHARETSTSTSTSRRKRAPYDARCRALPRRDEDSDAKQQQQPPSSSSWFVLEPDLWQRIKTEFPKPPWGPAGLLRVAGLSLAAAAAFAAADVLWLSTAATAAAPDSSSSSLPRALALAHLAREGLLAALIPGAVFLALKPDLDRAAAKKHQLTAAAAAEEEEARDAQPKPPSSSSFRLSASWSGPEARYWLFQALVTAAVAFPLAEPVLSSATSHALAALSGATTTLPPSSSSSSAFASAVRAAAEAGDWPSVGAHALASGALAPIWEEVFWRGFFLASLARVAPDGRWAVGASALGFAALHLGAPSPPSLVLLGACCDLLYLRSGGNLAAPLLFHGLWNTGQVAAVALGLKDGFV